MGLERIKSVMKSANNPQKGFDSVLVGGTNGKGSVATLLANLMGTKHPSVGLYTSPHIFAPSERVRINGKPVPLSKLEELSRKVEKLSRKAEVLLTPFELFTAVAFLAFAQARVDWVVAEVGMGGRLDATNILDAQLSLITSVGLEHREWLGNTLSQVAWEKAGIIKDGRDVVVGRLPQEAMDVVLGEVKNRGARLHSYGREYCIRVTKKSLEGVEFFYFSREIPKGIGNLRVRGLGEHFALNAAMALRAFEILCGSHSLLELEGELNRVMTDAWPSGRGQVVSLNGRIRILDVAHNPQGVDALCGYLQGILESPPLVLFSVLKDKDWVEMVRRLKGSFGEERLIFVALEDERVVGSSEIVTKCGVRSWEPDEAREVLLGDEATVVVCGCFAVVRWALINLQSEGWVEDD